MCSLQEHIEREIRAREAETWTAPEDGVYLIGFDQDGHLTGTKQETADVEETTKEG